MKTPNYSNGEMSAMIAAFAKEFNVSKDVASQQASVEWMQEAPIAIVEYDGYFKGEKEYDRNNRMEIASVYNGDISELVSYLRHLYPDRKSTPKWALIFQVYSDIIDVRATIERAESQATVSSEVESVSKASNESEVVQENPSASIEEPSEDAGTNAVTSNEELPSVDVPTDSHEDVPTAQVADISEQPSGNVESEGASLLYKESNNTNSMEVKEMSGIDDLLKGAEGARTQNPAESQKPAGAANTAATKADMKAAQQRVAELLQNENQKRVNWTRSNVVTNIISTQEPAANRRKSDSGKVITETDTAKAADAINGKIQGFIQNVTGKKGLTVDQFEALTDDEKYVNVVPGIEKVNDVEVSNVDKAKAMYQLLKQVKQNPAMDVPAFIPAKLSYPVKGYEVGNVPMSIDEFIIRLLDESTGAAYGEGGINENGKEVDGATSFKVVTVKKTEKAQAAALSTVKKEKRIPIIRIKNKASFTEGGKHIVYLFTQKDSENEGRASFRAALNVNGVMVSAGVTVYALDDAGSKIVTGHNDKTNQDVYKKKQSSISVSVPVTKILREFGAEFKGDSDTLVAASRWNVNVGASKVAQGNFGEIKEVSEAPVMSVLSLVMTGELDVSSKIAESETMKRLRAAANAQAQAEAADAAASLV